MGIKIKNFMLLDLERNFSFYIVHSLTWKGRKNGRFSYCGLHFSWSLLLIWVHVYLKTTDGLFYGCYIGSFHYYYSKMEGFQFKFFFFSIIRLTSTFYSMNERLLDTIENWINSGASNVNEGGLNRRVLIWLLKNNVYLLIQQSENKY